MIKVKPGSFSRPTRHLESDSLDQRVTISEAFFLSDCEVTTDQFRQFMTDDGYPYRKPRALVLKKGVDRKPVDGVSWFDAIMYCNWLSYKEGRPAYYRLSGSKRALDRLQRPRSPREMKYRSAGKVPWLFLTLGLVDSEEFDVSIMATNGYRLPTEAEWEYACRVGTTTRFHFGDDDLFFDTYSSSARQPTTGIKPCNGWGLFDMHGGVSEWCQDIFERYPASRNELDPQGPGPATYLKAHRVLRGGSWSSSRSRSASASRSMESAHTRLWSIGFRVAATADSAGAGLKEVGQ